MGRKAPEQEYEIIFCSNQKYSNWDTNTQGWSLSQLRIKRGLVNSSLPGFPTSGFILGPNMLAYVTDDKVAHVNFDPINYPGAGSTTNTVLKPFYVYDNNRTKYFGGTVEAPPKLTGISIATTTISSNAYYEKLDNSGGVLLTNARWDTARGSGYQVFLQRITFDATGVVLGTTQVIPDTVNINAIGTATGTTVRFTFPAIAADPSYTGDVKRVLVGYLGASGATSGQLCARLAEVSGDTITYGDPVVIRSTLSSGTLRQSIDITYHASGTDAGCFVIATAVDPGNLATKHSTSGELVACNPPSGLVLAGYFGTPVALASGTSSGSATQLSCVKCAAVNITDSGAGEPSVGYASSIQGQTAGTATGVYIFQKYFVSGTTITTGATLQMNHGTSTLGRWGNQIEMSGTLARYVPRIVFISPEARYGSSGLVATTTVIGTGASGYAGVSGSGVMSIYSIDVTTGTTFITGLRTSDYISNASGGEGRSQGPYVMPNNPYSGDYISYFRFAPNVARSDDLCLELGRLNAATTTGNVGICLLTTGDNYFADAIPAYVLPYNNIIATYGVFPNYEYVVSVNQGQTTSVIEVFNFGTSGERWRNAGHAFSGYSSGTFGIGYASSVGDNYGYKTPLAKIIGLPGVNATGIVATGDFTYLYFDSISGVNPLTQYIPNSSVSGAVIAKVALTESERRRLASNSATGFVLIDTRNQLEDVE